MAGNTEQGLIRLLQGTHTKVFLLFLSLGYFEFGLRQGKGIYTWADKSYYKGDWD